MRGGIFGFLLAWAISAGSVAVAQDGATLPRASQIANHVGQTVQFQDEVKAVSYSKATKGYYLSFGAPYPKQILSVWVDGKMYNRLHRFKTMVGRTVQITGQIETSPTGPLIRLASKEQFQTVATDESILAKPTLDGKQDRAQFQTAVFQTFKREDFGTLEVLGAELQQNRERLNDGSWLIESFFDAFRVSVRKSLDYFASIEQKLLHWEEAKPNSPILPLIKAGFHLDRAWKWRGTGYSDTVTKEGWLGFKEELDVASEILRTNQSAKVFPEYFSLMQTVALGQGWSRDQYERLFEEAIRTEPEYYTFYCQKAYYLLPRWHGKKGEWEWFADDMRQQYGPGGAGDALYARIAMSKREFYDDIFRDAAISWDKVASGYEYLIRQYPDSHYLRSLYANLCWKQGDRARLRKALAQMSEPDMTVWVNLENVSLAEKFAGKVTGR